MNKQNIPQLRFPRFKEEWKIEKTKNIAPLQRGFDLPTSEIKDGDYPVVYSNGILRNHCEFKVKAPGVVTGRSGTIGAITYVEENFWPHNTSLWVTDFKGNNPKFIYYFYLNFKLDRYNAGSTVPTLNRNDVHSVSKCFPSLPEQTKIASFLTAVDKRISLLQKKKTQLEQYKKGAMQKIFNQELRFKPDLSEAEGDDDKDFPDWEEKKLGDICEMTSSKRVYLSDYVESGIPFYRGKEITEIKEGKEPSDILYITKERYHDYKNKYGVPKKGDILITAVGTLGNVLKIRNNKEFYFKDGNLIWLKNIKENSDFLEILIQVNTPNLIKTSIGSTQKALTMVELRKLTFNFPSLIEQQKIASFLSSIDKNIEITSTQIKRMQEWKKGLLQKMFV